MPHVVLWVNCAYSGFKSIGFFFSLLLQSTSNQKGMSSMNSGHRKDPLEVGIYTHDPPDEMGIGNGKLYRAFFFLS